MTGKKLLVADDSLTIQKVIRLALSNEGYDIQTVSDGDDATQQIAVFRPDVVLIDVSLPGKSAVEVKKIVDDHGNPKDVRFVLMSSAFEKVDEEQVQRVHFHGRLTKPFDPAHLRRVLTDVLSLPGSDEMPPLPETESSMPSIQLTPPTDELEEEEENQDEDSAIEMEPMQPAPSPSPIASFLDLTPPPLPDFPSLPEIESQPESDFGPLKGGDDDIRHLTESTIKMSGLEDFQWSVNESALKSPFQQAEPAIPPTPAMADLGGTTLKPAGARAPVATSTPAPAASPTHAAGVSVSPVSMEQLEQVVAHQLRETIERMAQKLLPEVAERIIKAEIHKMLSEK